MDIKTIIEHWVTWFKAHERLVLLLAIGFFGVHFYGKGLDYLTKRDQTQAQIAKDQAQSAIQKVSNDDRANQQNLAQLAQLQNSFNSLYLQVSKSMQDRAIQSNKQKQSDDLSGPADLAARIRSLEGVGNISVSTPLGDTLIFSLDAAHKIARDEEDLVQAQGDLKDVNTKLVACQTVTTKQTDTIAGLNNQITDEKTALSKEQESHKSDVKVLKSEKRSAYLTGAKIGGAIAVIAVEAFRIIVLKRP